jgi:hypothetical protein
MQRTRVLIVELAPGILRSFCEHGKGRRKIK